MLFCRASCAISPSSCGSLRFMPFNCGCTCSRSRGLFMSIDWIWLKSTKPLLFASLSRPVRSVPRFELLDLFREESSGIDVAGRFDAHVRVGQTAMARNIWAASTPDTAKRTAVAPHQHRSRQTPTEKRAAGAEAAQSAAQASRAAATRECGSRLGRLPTDIRLGILE